MKSGWIAAGYQVEACDSGVQIQLLGPSMMSRDFTLPAKAVAKFLDWAALPNIRKDVLSLDSAVRVRSGFSVNLQMRSPETDLQFLFGYSGCELTVWLRGELAHAFVLAIQEEQKRR